MVPDTPSSIYSEPLPVLQPVYGLILKRFAVNLESSVPSGGRITDCCVNSATRHTSTIATGAG